jgi:hypothetical protein
MPEGNTSFDVVGCILCVGVVPGRIPVSLAGNYDIEVICRAFPRADSVVITGLKKFPVD